MRDIKGYEGLYAVTSCGKVWSYRRQKFISPTKTKQGYLQVKLYNNGKYEYYYIHRLVAEAYIPNPENKPQVNHVDEIKEHNYINNLCWMTEKENSNYGTRSQRIAKAVYCIELDREFESITAAGKELGIDLGGISRACSGKRKAAGGYHWKYIK